MLLSLRVNGLNSILTLIFFVLLDFYDLNGSKVEASSPTDNNNNCDATETVVFDGSGNLSNSSYCSGSLIFYEDFGNSDNRVNESAWMVVEQFSDAPVNFLTTYV